MCRSVGTGPGILGLVWLRFRPQFGSTLKIPGRILKSFRGPFSSAESRVPEIGENLGLGPSLLGARPSASRLVASDFFDRQFSVGS